ncbi:hypothetical protein [Streptomyces sp. NPDC008240]|uniref:hypothetical protein n=1 Tax=Streptomyces sp. NPDC008240 TaxID=3364822 RepID=UPI0036EB2570
MTTNQPLTDQQLDEIVTMPSAEDIDTLVAEVRRLHAELAAARATTLREAAGVADGATNLFTDSDEGAAAAGALEGLAIRFRRMADAAQPPAEESHVVADDSDDPEHVDDCPGCTGPCGHDDYHDPHEWADRPGVWCPGISYADDQPAAAGSAAANEDGGR